ncbi:MAG: hypothetical protein IKU11_01625 [Clostridia bacterium]|nr:hypothetical protein [Clostridia bacterium]
MLCESCAYYAIDEETGEGFCTINLDEDELYRFLQSKSKECPYYRYQDDYTLAGRQ